MNTDLRLLPKIPNDFDVWRYIGSPGLVPGTPATFELFTGDFRRAPDRHPPDAKRAARGFPPLTAL